MMTFRRLLTKERFNWIDFVGIGFIVLAVHDQYYFSAFLISMAFNCASRILSEKTA